MSPSSRRAWVEISLFCLVCARVWNVALLAEGVGRNISYRVARRGLLSSSPSSRRAWVEIWLTSNPKNWLAVALLAEGVGRNQKTLLQEISAYQVALLAEGVGRNSLRADGAGVAFVALLAEGVGRNAAPCSGPARPGRTSPSSRRAWVEIPVRSGECPRGPSSPSSRRAWVEIADSSSSADKLLSRPPRGGRG